MWTDGTGLASPEAAEPVRGAARGERARAKGVKFLLNHKMTSLIRAASLQY